MASLITLFRLPTSRRTITNEGMKGTKLLICFLFETCTSSNCTQNGTIISLLYMCSWVFFTHCWWNSQKNLLRHVLSAYTVLKSTKKLNCFFHLRNYSFTRRPSNNSGRRKNVLFLSPRTCSYSIFQEPSWQKCLSWKKKVWLQEGHSSGSELSELDSASSDSSRLMVQP